MVLFVFLLLSFDGWGKVSFEVTICSCLDEFAPATVCVFRLLLTTLPWSCQEKMHRADQFLSQGKRRLCRDPHIAVIHLKCCKVVAFTYIA